MNELSALKINKIETHIYLDNPILLRRQLNIHSSSETIL